jgi:hypothetical protein
MENATASKIYKSNPKNLICVKNNYHQRGGREKQLIRYYFRKNPELDPATFHADLDPLDRLMKLKDLHFKKRIMRNTVKFNQTATPTQDVVPECDDTDCVPVEQN